MSICKMEAGVNVEFDMQHLPFRVSRRAFLSGGVGMALAFCLTACGASRFRTDQALLRREWRHKESMREQCKR